MDNHVIWLLTRGGDDGWETLTTFRYATKLLFCLIYRITVSVRRGALSIAIGYLLEINTFPVILYMNSM